MMNRPTRAADTGPLRERMDALIDRMAEPVPEPGQGIASDDDGTTSVTKGLPGEGDEASLDDNRLRVPGA